MPYALVFLLLSPFFILFFNFPDLKLPGSSELVYVFKFTFTQAILSSLISVVVGFFASLSLLNMSSKKIKVIEFFCLIPCFVPTIFVVFSFVNLSLKLKFDVSGMWGIVIIHMLINVGLCAVILTKILKSKLFVSNKLFAVQSHGLFNYFKILIPLIYRDLLYLFSSVFLFCFTSFSIPLIIGGVQSTTVDLLVYEKIISGDIGEALSIALLQFIFIGIFLIFMNLLSKNRSNKITSVELVKPFKFNSSYLLALVPTLILSLGLVIGFPFSSIINLLHELSFSTVLFSFLLSLISGYLMFLFIQLFLAQLPSQFLSRFMSMYSSPSAALVCLSFLLISPQSDFLKMMSFLTFIIIFVPFLFKMFLENFISEIMPSIKLSRAYGASSWRVYKTIIFPTSFQVSLFLSFITAAWVMGDYAVSSILLESNATIALKIKSYMRSYRLEDAFGLVLILLFCEIILYLIYKGLSCFAYKKY